jgi:hypothetical protein
MPAGGSPETGHVEVAEPFPGHFWFTGWARNPVKGVAADYVVLGWQGSDNSFHPFTAIPTGRVRPKVEEAYGAGSRKGGFDQGIDISKLPSPDLIIRAWAVDWETQQAFAIEGAIHVNPPRS